MTKEQAIHNFWSSFDLTAYDENSVPTGDSKPDLPYITYELVTGSLGDEIAMTASLWYKSSSWQSITTKCNEISAYIDLGGRLIEYDDGAVWIKRNTPFSQRMSESSDNTIRRIVLNITAEYLSAD